MGNSPKYLSGRKIVYGMIKAYVSSKPVKAHGVTFFNIQTHVIAFASIK